MLTEKEMRSGRVKNKIDKTKKRSRRIKKGMRRGRVKTRGKKKNRSRWVKAKRKWRIK